MIEGFGLAAFAWDIHASQAVVFATVGAGCVGLVRYVIIPVLKFARRVETSLVFVEGQMRTNGGSTLRDKVDALVERVNSLETGAQAVERTHGLEAHLTQTAITVAKELKENP